MKPQYKFSNNSTIKRRSCLQTRSHPSDFQQSTNLLASRDLLVPTFTGFLTLQSHTALMAGGHQSSNAVCCHREEVVSEDYCVHCTELSTDGLEGNTSFTPQDASPPQDGSVLDGSSLRDGSLLGDGSSPEDGSLLRNDSLPPDGSSPQGDSLLKNGSSHEAVS